MALMTVAGLMSQSPHSDSNLLRQHQQHVVGQEPCIPCLYEAHRSALSLLCEWVLSSQVELRYVRTNWQVANIFTKVLGTDKLRLFWEMLGIQHLNMPHLRWRVVDEPEKEPTERKSALEEEAESIEEVKASGRVGTSSKGGRVKRNKADRKKKVKNKTCSDMVKSLKKDEELETANSNESRNEMKTVDSVKWFD